MNVLNYQCEHCGTRHKPYKATFNSDKFMFYPVCPHCGGVHSEQVRQQIFDYFYATTPKQQSNWAIMRGLLAVVILAGVYYFSK